MKSVLNLISIMGMQHNPSNIEHLNITTVHKSVQFASKYSEVTCNGYFVIMVYDEYNLQ